MNYFSYTGMVNFLAKPFQRHTFCTDMKFCISCTEVWVSAFAGSICYLDIISKNYD